MLSRLVTWLPFSMKQSNRLTPASRKWLAMGEVTAAVITDGAVVVVVVVVLAVAVVDAATTLLPLILLLLVATDAGKVIDIRL
jgi:hypothetical protein